MYVTPFYICNKKRANLLNFSFLFILCKRSPVTLVTSDRSFAVQLLDNFPPEETKNKRNKYRSISPRK